MGNTFYALDLEAEVFGRPELDIAGFRKQQENNILGSLSQVDFLTG
ncbi:MAG: hypothetical protein PHP51_02985 [Desulfotomaculaceae bacterium]|nr:hypothetical protein [Desulfotomaculaceae bacterium]